MLRFTEVPIQYNWIANQLEKKNKRFKYIRSRKPVRKLVSQLDLQGVKATLKQNKNIAKKLNDFYASAFTTKHVVDIPTLALFDSGYKNEALSWKKKVLAH